MKKKFVLSILSVIIIVSLSACSSKSATISPTPNSVSPTSSSPAATPVASAKTVNLTVIGGGWDEANYSKVKADNPADLHVQTKDAVTKDYPNYKVDYQNWGWAEALDQKQRAAILSGNTPDIVHGETFMPAYAQGGILAPLPEDIVNMVNPNFLITNKEGKPVAVSPRGTIFLLYYNPDLLKQAGVDGSNPPLKTWDDWKAVSDKVTAAGNGKFFGGGIPSHPHAGGALRITAFIRSLGADWGGDMKATFNTPEMAKALQFVRDMDKNFPKGVGNGMDEGPIYDNFGGKSRTIAFVVNGTWQEAEALQKGYSMGVAPIPVAPGGKPSNTLVGFDYYGVTVTSQHKEEGFNIIREMLKKDVLSAIAKHDLNPVASKEVLGDASIMDSNPVLKMTGEQLAIGEFKGLPTFSKNDGQIWDLIDKKIIARTTITKDPIEQILKEAQTEADGLLK